MHLVGTIISFHFIEKGKQHSLKYSRGVPNSKVCLQHLEINWNISDDFLRKLEEFLCHICVMREKDVNVVPFEKYYKKYQNENKVVDISTLLPC